MTTPPAQPEATPLARLCDAGGLPPPPWMIGHRGAPAEATENSIASLLAAAAAGADAIECDVQLTADGEPVVFHDWTLERLAADPAVVEATPWRELRSRTLRDPARGTTAQPLPHLREVLDALPPELPLNLELKRRRAAPRRLVEAVLEARRGRGRVWVSSFDWDLLDLLHAAAPDLPLAPLASRRRRGFEDRGRRLSAVALHVSTRALSSALLRRSRAAAMPVLVYTVDTAAEARALFGRGTAGVFTNEIGTLRAALR